MKKIILLISVFCIYTTNIEAQGFLKKLKQSVESITKSDEKKKESTENPIINEEEIIPAKGNTAEELLSQLPSLISTEALLNPQNKDSHQDYLNKIYSVELRLWELEQEYESLDSESNEDALAARVNNQTAHIMGLTPEEMREMNDEKTSEKRIKELEDKMARNMTGMSGAQMEAMEKMSDKEQEAYIAKHADMNKVIATGAREQEARDLKLEEYGKLNKQLAEKELSFQKKFDSALAVMEKIASKYTDELSAGYKQMYLTANSQQRDMLTDKLAVLSDRCRKECVVQWHSAHQALIIDIKSTAPDLKRHSQLKNEIEGTKDDPRAATLGVVGGCIKALRDAVDFNVSDDAMPAMEMVLYDGPGYIHHLESAIGFTPITSGATTNGSGLDTLSQCGTFINSKFLVAERDKFYVVQNGKKIEQFDDMKTATKHIFKDSDAESKHKLQNEESYMVREDANWQSVSGKRSAKVVNGNIVLNDGSIYMYPIAVKRCGEFLIWLCFRNDKLVECSYRL